MQLRERFKKNPLLSIYLAVFFFSVHSAFTSYINSSFLSEGRGLSESKVGLLYTLGSCITLIILMGLPKLTQKVSLKKLLILTVTFLIMLLTGLIVIQNNPFVTGLLFILYLASSSGIFFLNDIFVEHYTSNNSTGKIRGIFFTVINLAWVVSPFLAGIIAQSNSGFQLIYMIALVLMILTLIITTLYYKQIDRTKTISIPLLTTIKSFFKNLALRRIFITSFILQLFYAVMIIYSPIYLHQVMGLSWTHIGLAFTCMLTAFVLFQIPLGRLADTKYGEKEILSGGLIIMTVMTYVFAHINTPHWYIWALVLFGTRVGAAAVEIMCESYFFKQINDAEHGSIALFRSSSPLAYILAPLVISGLLTLEIITYQHVFILLAVCVGLGLFVSMRMVDTK